MENRSALAPFKTPLFVCLAFCCFILSILWRLGIFEKNPPAAPRAGPQYVLVEGRLLRPLSKGWLLEAEKISEKAFSGRLYLAGQNPAEFLAPDLAAGSRVITWGRLIRPRKPLGPETLGWSGYLAQAGASAAVTIDRPGDLKVLSGPAGFTGLVQKLRNRASAQIIRSFPDPRVYGLLGGLIIGDKRLLDRSLKDEFIAAGVMHLLVVSGLHITLWGSMLYFTAVFILGLGRRPAGIFVFAGIWGFAAFIGLNPPVARAALMASFLFAGGILRRETPALARLFLAAFVLLAINPAAIKDPSFLLSFTSTFGILCGWRLAGLLPVWRRFNQAKFSGAGFLKIIVSSAATSLFAWFWLLPFSGLFFNQISLVAPISNLVLVPFSGLLLGLGVVHLAVLEWIPFVSQAGLMIVDCAAKCFLAVVHFFAAWPLSTVAVAAWGVLPWLSWLCLGAAWLFLLRPKRLLIGLAGAFIFGLAHFTHKAFSRPKIFLFGESGAYQAAYIEKGLDSALCEPDPQTISIRVAGEISAFLKSRGKPNAPNACASAATASGRISALGALRSGAARLSLKLKLPSGAFFGPESQISAACGPDVFLFPAGPYPIIPESASLAMLECKNGNFERFRPNDPGFL